MCKTVRTSTMNSDPKPGRDKLFLVGKYFKFTTALPSLIGIRSLPYSPILILTFCIITLSSPPVSYPYLLFLYRKPIFSSCTVPLSLCPPLLYPCLLYCTPILMFPPHIPLSPLLRPLHFYLLYCAPNLMHPADYLLF